ncbi:MAG: OmpA family protein, partial [Bacteroidota bacterium]
YRLDIVASKEMETGLISVKDIDNELEEKGSMVLHGVLFKFGKATLLPESLATIETIASYLKQHPKTSIFVVGHTDNIGDFNSNLKLSEERAMTVVRQLVSNHGIAKDRLEGKGVSMLAPISTNHTEEGRKLNRRVAIVKK